MSLLEEPGGHGADGVSFNTLGGWAEEMDKCKAVDPNDYWRYYNTFAEANATQQARLDDFVIRHHLWDQFIAEDAAGKR